MNKIKEVCAVIIETIGSIVGKMGRAFVNFFKHFAQGDKITKLSYVVMGAGCFLRGQIQVLCSCIGAGNFRDIVVVIERLSCFNNSRGRHVLCIFPGIVVYLRLPPFFADSANSFADLGMIYANRIKNTVFMFLN